MIDFISNYIKKIKEKRKWNKIEKEIIEKTNEGVDDELSKVKSNNKKNN